MSPRTGPVVRALLLALVLGGQAGLLVWAGTLGPDPAAHRYPGDEDLARDYDRYVGQRAEISGTVVSTEPLVVETDHLRLAVRDAAVSPSSGDRLNVFGVVQPNRAIRATTASVIPTSGLWYTWAISFVAGLWVLGRIVRHWRVDRDALGLVPRSAFAPGRGGEGPDA